MIEINGAVAACVWSGCGCFIDADLSSRFFARAPAQQVLKQRVRVQRRTLESRAEAASALRQSKRK
jgi:hypothetical protein